MTSTDTQVPFTATVLSQRDYILVMCLLRQFQADGTLGKDDLDALLALVAGEDLAGRKWFYDPDNAIWARTDVQPWQDGVPRGPLLVALPTELWEEIQILLDRIATEEADARGAEGPAASNAPRFCPNCGNALVSGQKFCTRCGQDMKPFQ